MYVGACNDVFFSKYLTDDFYRHFYEYATIMNDNLQTAMLKDPNLYTLEASNPLNFDQRNDDSMWQLCQEVLFGLFFLIKQYFIISKHGSTQQTVSLIKKHFSICSD
jgi:hypothetical protein